jgi:hypothetical protein
MNHKSDLIVGLTPSQVKPKSINLAMVFAASLYAALGSKSKG